MAFRAPTHPAPQRHHHIAETAQSEAPSFLPPKQIDDSQEWVLFSPAAPSTTRTQTTSTERTRTAGLSRLSDFGSLDTAAAPSDAAPDLADSDRPRVLEGAGYDDEEGELESLDSHLQAFREPSVYRRSSRDYGGATVLPAHDGLGLFAASGSPVQEQIYQFEQFNPRRRRRRSSLMKTLEEQEEERLESTRNQRIQDWRMDQSRALLDEIERETRRRRLSRVSERRTSVQKAQVPKIKEATEVDDYAVPERQEELQADESFWKRITRRVIRDLIGIDESTLSVILGESLPEVSSPTSTPRTDPSSFPIFEETTSLQLDSSWEDRLLQRLARELGNLVHQLSEHPGAFSTYLRTQQSPEYVGRTTPTSPLTRSRPMVISASIPAEMFSSSAEEPKFIPTIPRQPSEQLNHDASWGMEDSAQPEAAKAEEQRLRAERDYWERELDVSMVFSFLRNRFRGRSTAPHHSHAHLATSSTESTAARAAMIRHHHPLVSRAQKEHQRRRSSGLYRPGSAAGVKRPSSSCASQSERGRRTKGSGSSRNYWDLGDSVGTGSIVAATGGLGAWGEV
ncbi:MAG: hypothetical protein M1817_000956 [Caeruleum heppii]|nr:MAG: hypothetical protein M1817_000956 [Caeruleum heppii]